MRRYTEEPITEEIVLAAERNTARLRHWWNGVRWRQAHYPTASDYHRDYLERITKKIGESDAKPPGFDSLV